MTRTFRTDFDDYDRYFKQQDKALDEDKALAEQNKIAALTEGLVTIIESGQQELDTATWNTLNVSSRPKSNGNKITLK